MFLDGHQLEGVVSQARDPWKDFGAEPIEICNSRFLCTHAYVRFIDQGMSHAGWIAVFPFIGFRRFPYLGTEYLGFRILDTAPCVGRETLSCTSRPLYEPLEELTVAQRFRWQHQLPIA